MVVIIQAVWFYLLSLFSSSLTLDTICKRPAETDRPITGTLRKIVNRLRRYDHWLPVCISFFFFWTVHSLFYHLTCKTRAQ